MFQVSSLVSDCPMPSNLSTMNGNLSGAIHHLTQHGIQFSAPITSRVYLATHFNYGKVIIKFAVNTTTKSLLKNEAEFLNNTSKVLQRAPVDYAHYQGIDYLMLSYINGDTLADITKRDQPLPSNWRPKIEQQLQLIHKQGYIHGDIKPANILIRNNGTPELIDFGSTLRLGSAYKNTPSHSLSPRFAAVNPLYKVGYSAPKDDWYSLAATLHYIYSPQCENQRSELSKNSSILVSDLPTKYQILLLKQHPAHDFTAT